MLTLDQLKILLDDLESDRIERTESTNDTDKFCEAVCAFANDLPQHKQPGYLLIGVRKNGSLSGLTVTESLLEKLGGIRSDGNVLPQPVLTVAKFSFPDGDVAVVEVLPSDLPPIRYKGRVWVRIEPRKATANEQEERQLSERRTSFSRSFDATPCLGAGMPDISFRLFEEYRQQVVASDVIESNHRSLEEQMASLRFHDLQRNVPTMAGILLFGINPRFFLPGAYVQFLKLPGISLTDEPEDQAEFSGDLRTLLDQIKDKFRANNQNRMQRTEGFTEELSPDYPEWAVRELLHNAVMHGIRRYSANFAWNR